jgi:putative acetyltransferase
MGHQTDGRQTLIRSVPVNQPSDLVVRIAVSPSDLAAVRELWREYWKSMDLPDDFQGFDEELKGLPGAYGADGGALLIAASALENAPAGTIALRRLNRSAGEIKRLYLRPAFRGKGLGRYLLEQVIERARGIGYEALYADTLPRMQDALSLYERLGFARVEAYASNPTPGAVYLRLDLLKLQLC